MSWLNKLLVTAAAILTITGAVTFFSGRAQGNDGATGASPAAAPSSTDTVIRGLQARLQSNANDPDALENLGFAYLQKVRETGDPSLYPKADAVFHDALTQRPNDQQALIGLSSVALNRHEFETALQFAKQALGAGPATSAVYGALGDAQMELGHYDDAADAFQHMVDLRPDLASYVRVSYARELHGDIPGAIAAMKMAVGAGGVKGENLAWTHLQLGNLYFNQGDLDGAEGQYESALTAFPGYVHAIAGQGKVAAARGQYADAERLYQEAVDRLPMVQYVVALGDVYTADSKPADARRQYDLVGAITQLYQANGVNTDLEIAVFDADHDIDLQEAVAQARSVYDSGPSIPAADALAWALFKSGNAVEAETYARAALRLGSQDAAVHYHAGMIYKALGRDDHARSELSMGLSINPHFSTLQAPIAQQALREVGG